MHYSGYQLINCRMKQHVITIKKILNESSDDQRWWRCWRNKWNGSVNDTRKNLRNTQDGRYASGFFFAVVSLAFWINWVIEVAVKPVRIFAVLQMNDK